MTQYGERKNSNNKTLVIRVDRLWDDEIEAREQWKSVKTENLSKQRENSPRRTRALLVRILQHICHTGTAD